MVQHSASDAVLLAWLNTLHAAGRCAATMSQKRERAHRLRLVSGAPLRICCHPLTAEPCWAAKAGGQRREGGSSTLQGITKRMQGSSDGRANGPHREGQLCVTWSRAADQLRRPHVPGHGRCKSLGSVLELPPSLSSPMRERDQSDGR